MEIGDRLKEERVRLGMSQTEMATLGQVQRNTLFNYEKGLRSPDADFLARIAARGVDVLYVVTGQRVQSMLDAEQSRHLAAFARLPLAVREWLLGAVETGAAHAMEIAAQPVSYESIPSGPASLQLHQTPVPYNECSGLSDGE